MIWWPHADEAVVVPCYSGPNAGCPLGMRRLCNETLNTLSCGGRLISDHALTPPFIVVLDAGCVSRSLPHSEPDVAHNL